MKQTLLDALLEENVRLTPRPGFCGTGIDGFHAVRREGPGEKRGLIDVYAAIILEGVKRTSFDGRILRIGPGGLVVNSIVRPSVTVIESASPERPFRAFVLTLERRALLKLTRALPQEAPLGRRAPEDELPIWTVPADDELAECCLRLARTAGREREAALLAPILKREMAARLLLGPLGPWIRSALSDAARSSRIADAAARIRSEFEKPLSVAGLARSANMSSATFHRHFKAMTGLSPIQYQKAARLNEARSLIVEESSRISDAAYRVGYASASQFAADYRHFFWRSPSDDRRRTAARES